MTDVRVAQCDLVQDMIKTANFLSELEDATV